MYVHEVLVNCLGGLSLPRKSVVRLTDRPDMTLDVYCGRKTTMQQKKISELFPLVDQSVENYSCPTFSHNYPKTLTNWLQIDDLFFFSNFS